MWILALSCAVVPCVFTTYWQDTFYLPKLLVLWVLLGVLVWILGVMALRRRLRFSFVWWIDLPIAFFIAWNVLASLLSVDVHESLFGAPLQDQGLLSLVLYAGFFYIARLLVIETAQLVLVFGGILVGASLVSAYALIQRAGLDPIWKGALLSGRVFSTIGQPDDLAAYLVLAIATTVALGLVTNRWLQLVVCLAIAIMLAAFLFTLSRGGLLGLVVAMPFLAAAFRRRFRRLITTSRRLMAVVALIGLVTLIALPAFRVAIARTWDRAEAITNSGGDVSIQDHLDEWRVATRVIEENPLVGTGPETFSDVFPSMSRQVLSSARVRYFDNYLVETPENNFLAIAASAGIPALLAYLALLVAVVWVIFGAVRRSGNAGTQVVLVALLGAIAAHLVTDSFMSTEVTGSWTFWMLCGAGVGVALEHRRARRPGLLLDRDHVVQHDTAR